MRFSEWDNVKLKDITTKIGSGATPRGGSNSYQKEGIAFIRSQNVYNCSFNTNGLVFINNEQADKLKNVEIKKDDILLNITGDSVARCTNVPDEFIGGRVNQHVAIIRTQKDKLNPDYLKYYLVSPYMQSFMISLARIGGTRAALTKGMIESFEIPLPPIEEQKAIANILSALDKKIEINNQINKKLEEMAQTIFKHWFIDFEFPNEDGEPYKSSGGEMVESKLGIIPENWEVISIGELFLDILGGEWGKENEDDKHTIPVMCIRGADLPEVKKGKKGNVPMRFIKEDAFNKKRLKTGDIIIEISGGSPTQSTGRSVYISQEVLNKFNNKVVCTNFCRALRPKDVVFTELAYCFLEKLYKANTFFQYENGTTGIKNLDLKNVLSNEKLAIPKDLKLIREFNKNISMILKKIQENGNENHKLAEIRDTLLPKLMSGEIRVPLDN
ncbi:MAG: type restriction enzyme subunit [Candidatus Petromonas sp.]|jgi:type I restriction enzyme S subunit|nr:type restriction enzyme subunit [Clostridia bacterium]MDK2920234.1 type restriction enzyme subunit [Candidatus Petromonas sp.]